MQYRFKVMFVHALKMWQRASIPTPSVIFTISIYVLVLCQFCAATSNFTARNVNYGSELNRELILTREEKAAFDEFKKKVWPLIFAEQWKNDLYLLRWIRAKNLDVDLSLKDFIGLKSFYFDNHIDKVAEEDWSDFEHDFPVHHGTRDREGRPVTCIHLRDGWSLRAAILQGKQLRMERYWSKIVFDILSELSFAQKQSPNVTQFLVVVNADGFAAQDLCPRCIYSLMKMLQLERYLPGFFREVIVVDVPNAFVLAYHTISPVLTKNMRDSLRIFDKNRNRWMNYVHKRIDPKQLPSFLGGAKPD